MSAPRFGGEVVKGVVTLMAGSGGVAAATGAASVAVPIVVTGAAVLAVGGVAKYLYDRSKKTKKS